MNPWPGSLMAIVAATAAALLVWSAVRWRERKTQRERRDDLNELIHEAATLTEAKNWPEAEAALGRALDRARPDDYLCRELHSQRGAVLEKWGKPRDAARQYAAAQEGLAPDEPGKSLEALREGRAWALAEEWQQATVALERAMEWARLSRQANLLFAARQLLIRAKQATRRFADALTLVEEACVSAQEARDESTHALLLNMAGDCCLALGQWDSAAGYYERCLDSFIRLGDLMGQRMVKRDIANLLQMRGEWDLQAAWLTAWLRDEEHEQSDRGQAQACFELGCLRAQTGEHADGVRWLYRSMAHFRNAGDRRGVDQVGRTLMGLGVLMHRAATQDHMTFRDIERGAASRADKVDKTEG